MLMILGLLVAFISVTSSLGQSMDAGSPGAENSSCKASTPHSGEAVRGNALVQKKIQMHTDNSMDAYRPVDESDNSTDTYQVAEPDAEDVDGASIHVPLETDPVEVTLTLPSSSDKIEGVISAALEKMGKSINSFDLVRSTFQKFDEGSEPTFPLTFNVTLSPRGAEDLAYRVATEHSMPTLLEERHTQISVYEESDSDSESLSLRTDANVSAHGLSNRGKRKHKKQKVWAAKMLGRLEKTVCKRKSREKTITPRECHALPWWAGARDCDGWIDVAGACCEPCGAGLNGVAVTCVGCNGWTEGAGLCWEPCGADGDVPQMPTGCINMYCSKDMITCANRIIEIGMAFGEVIGNLLPSRGLTKAAKAAAKAGKAAGKKKAKELLLKELRISADVLVKQAKGNLRKYMKHKTKELMEDVMDEILMDGAEGLLAMAEKEREPELAEVALEIAEAIDPTGFVGVVTSFNAEGCEEIRMDPMPEDGFDCNPSKCPNGLTCVNSPDICCKAGDWDCCGEGWSATKFSNRLYCPSKFNLCNNNFCEHDCASYGGTKFSDVPCSACNPTKCPNGLTCAHEPDKCCEAGKWDCCSYGQITRATYSSEYTKFNNRLYCPSEYNMCANSYCEIDCAPHGGTIFTTTSCQPVANAPTRRRRSDRRRRTCYHRRRCNRR